MFCPNCGTKNDEAALKCKQCGFDQVQKAKPAPNFKGTMVMKGSPIAASPAAGLGAGTGQPPSAGAGAAPAKTSQAKPNLKGTMVGIAPPGIQELRKQAEQAAAQKAAAQPAAAQPAASAKPKPNLKGTMVGVAPPGIEDLRKQAAQAAASTPAPASGASRPAASKGPPSHLKGTMIGVAPPDMGAEVEAAKAKLAAQKAAKAGSDAAREAVASAPAVDTAPSTTAAPAAPAVSKGPPSKLKGTMIGVAPPDMQAEIAAAKKQLAEQSASAAIDNDPPSEPDPLGGTMVGVSPFAASTIEPEETATTSAADSFAEDTPAAPSDQKEQARLSTETPEPGPTEQDSGPAAYAPPGVPQPQRIPVTKSPVGPILLLVGLLLAIAVVVYFIIKDDGTGDETAETAESAAEKAPEEAQADEAK